MEGFSGTLQLGILCNANGTPLLDELSAGEFVVSRAGVVESVYGQCLADGMVGSKLKICPHRCTTKV